MPWCPRCGTGLSQMEMNEGYQDREDPGLTVRLPAGGPARRGAPGLDDDALDAGRQRRRRRRRGPALRQGAPGRGPLLAGQGNPEAGAPRPVPGRGGAGRVGAGRLAVHGSVRRAAGGPGRRSRRRATSTAWSPGPRSARRRGPGIVHIAPGCGAEDYQLGREIGLPVIGPIDEDGRYYAGFDWLSGREAPDISEAILSRSRAAAVLLPRRAVQPPLSALLALRHAAPVPTR